MGICINKNRTLYIDGRDNAAQGTAQTNTDEMIVNVSGSIGPFVLHPKILII
jgi:hypothetical protein